MEDNYFLINDCIFSITSNQFVCHNIVFQLCSSSKYIFPYYYSIKFIHFENIDDYVHKCKSFTNLHEIKIIHYRTLHTELFFHLLSLTTLHTVHCNIDWIQDMAILTNLQKLNIFDNQNFINNILDNISQLNRLTSLTFDIKYHRFTTWNLSSNLKYLKLNSSFINPFNFSQYDKHSKLEHIDFTYRLCTQNIVINYSFLTHLKLAYKIREDSNRKDIIFSSTGNLRYLNLHNYRLEENFNLNAFVNLTCLKLKQVCTNNLDCCIYFSLTNLRILKLNRIYLSINLYNMTRLKILSCCYVENILLGENVNNIENIYLDSSNFVGKLNIDKIQSAYFNESYSCRINNLHYYIQRLKMKDVKIKYGIYSKMRRQ